MNTATTEPTKTTQQNELRANLDRIGAGGAGTYYRHCLPGVLITDGAYQLAELCGAHWLLDVVASWQLEPAKIPDPEFQVWKLELTPEGGAKIMCGDGNDEKREIQSIEYTDFPLPEGCTLWAVPTAGENGRKIIVIMHPREY
jgi:hypothetical protein